MNDEHSLRRMAGDYEIIQAIHIGDREIVLGEKPQSESGDKYMCAFCQQNELFAAYSEVMCSDNYAEMVKMFGERVTEQAEKTRVAMNAPIQGTAADIMKIAMIGVNRELKEKRMKSRMILQVHDELLIETHPDEIETVKEILKRQMETAASLDVPLIADMQVGKNWYEAK